MTLDRIIARLFGKLQEKEKDVHSDICEWINIMDAIALLRRLQ